MPRQGFQDFLWRSFELLADEEPGAWARFCRSLAPRTVGFRVDGDVFTLRFRREGPRRVATAGEPDVEVATSREAILRLIDAEHTLAGAVLADALHLRGRVGDLLAFHDGLMAYLHGAVRTHGFPDLLGEYRATPAAARAQRRSRPTARDGDRT